MKEKMAEARDNPTDCTPTRKSDSIKEMNDCMIQIVEEIRLVVMGK